MEISVFDLVIMDVNDVAVKGFTDRQCLQRRSGVLRAELWEYPHFSGGRRQRSPQLDSEQERKEGNLRVWWRKAS